MSSKICLLFPFDMGLELDFTGKDTTEFFKEISVRKMGSLSFEEKIFSDAEFSTQVYRFGVGIIQISFDIESDLKYLANLSCNLEKIKVGKQTIVQYCHSLVDGLIQRAHKYATHEYEKRLTEGEIFPIVLLKDTMEEDSNTYIWKNHKAIFGFLAGEPDYDSLSNFVLEQEKLVNYGYYEKEIVLIKRFGALVYSREATAILEMIKLAYSQYWSMRSYNYILDHEMEVSLKLIENMPPYYKFWKILQAYQKFSTEALGFDKDKIIIVDSLYNVLSSIPKVESDWHLRTVLQNVNTVFNIEELHKAVEVKIDKIEQSYNSAREFLSNNFFILLDIIFFLSLIWSIIDTFLLWKLSVK